VGIVPLIFEVKPQFEISATLLPDLNRIEPSWDTTKNDVRNYSYKSLSFYDKLFTSLNLRGWYGV